MRDMFLSQLRSFVGFRTTHDRRVDQHECLDWIQTAFFHNVMLPVHRGSVEGAPYIHLQHPEPRLLLFAHIDVVPGADDQFDLRVEDDRLVGRGTKDMKGPTLAMLTAYASLLEEGSVPPVSILLTADEETAAETIPHLIACGEFADIPVAFTPDTGSHDRIVTEHKGGVWLELVADGKGCHAAAPWKGSNPVQCLAHAITALEKAFPYGTEDEWRLTVVPSVLQGSRTYNVVPDRATCGLDVRYPPEDFSGPEAVRDRIAAELPQGCSVRIIHAVQPLRSDPAHPTIQLLRSVGGDVLGGVPSVGREHGASDARFFGVAGIPAFLYGPDGGDLHGAGEWVSFRSLMDHVEILRRFLIALPSARS